MQLTKSTRAPSSRAGGASATSATRIVPTRVVSAQALQEKLPIDVSTVVGERLGKWMSTPFDLLAFPARAGTGALVSLPERMQTLQLDVQRLVELVQDPRPVEEKQDVLRKELEDTVVMFLEKGTLVEQDVLSNIKAVLPPDAANVMSELIPEPPNKAPAAQSDFAYYYDAAGNPTSDPYSSSSAAAYSNAPTTTYGASDVITSQIASEITEIRNAVGGLKSALEAIKNNGESASAPMLRLRLKEARDQLQRRLLEVSPSTAPDPSLSAATREANILLDEVNALFFPTP